MGTGYVNIIFTEKENGNGTVYNTDGCGKERDRHKRDVKCGGNGKDAAGTADEDGGRRERGNLRQ